MHILPCTIFLDEQAAIVLFFICGLVQKLYCNYEATKMKLFSWHPSISSSRILSFPTVLSFLYAMLSHRYLPIQRKYWTDVLYKLMSIPCLIVISTGRFCFLSLHNMQGSVPSANRISGGLLLAQNKIPYFRS